jgi:tetratricopeptide (TPR) repeat protein
MTPERLTSTLLCIATLTASCNQRHAVETPNMSAEDRSVAVITEYLAKGDCRNAITYLQKQPESKRTPSWFDYLSQSHFVCGEQDPTGEEDQKALTVIDDGLRRYPDSSRLLKAKAERLQSLENSAEAARLYAAARDAAQRHISNGRGTDDDEMVLAEIRQESKRPRMETAATNVPTVNLETLPKWANEVPSLLAAGECQNAIRLLNEARDTNALWYELTAQSNAACFTQTKQESYAAAASATVNDGIGKYPASVRLRLSRAIVAEMLGQRAKAEDYYRETAELARTIESRQPTSPEAGDARRILQAIASRQEAMNPKPH